MFIECTERVETYHVPVEFCSGRELRVFISKQSRGYVGRQSKIDEGEHPKTQQDFMDV